jgi:hypothetical protein
LGIPVNFFPLQGLREFFLVVLIGQLNEQSMRFLLQVTLGGVAADFRPHQLSDRVFNFIVASRYVGFHIYNLRMFACQQYKIYFHLYGNGGAHWVSEYKKFIQEEADGWILVLGKRSRAICHQANKIEKNTLFRANRILMGHHRRSSMNFVQRNKYQNTHDQHSPVGNRQSSDSRQRETKRQISNFQRIRWPENQSFLHQHSTDRAQQRTWYGSGKFAHPLIKFKI